MSSAHYFLAAPSLYVARFSGVLTLADLIEGVDICRNSPDFKSSMPQLIDITQITRVDLTYPEQRSFMLALDSEYEHNETDISMFVLASNESAFGKSRQFQLLSEPLKRLTVSVFSDTASCMQALDLPDASIEALLERAIVSSQTTSA